MQSSIQTLMGFLPSNYCCGDPTKLQNGKKHLSTMKTHDNTIITTSNQTTIDSLNLESNPTSLGMVPVKLLLERDNPAVE
jgi:hypothetical protein